YSMYQNLGLPREKWQQADDLWILHYGEEPPSLIEGAQRTIDELSRRGYSLGIVSSGSESRVRGEIGKLELTNAFGAVICNEDTVNKKPDPEGLHKAIEAMSKRPETCAYVGDSPEDIEMGKRAQVLTVGVRSAYPGSKRILSARPEVYLESLPEMLHIFKSPLG
ncbi:MAG TPA: HAD family hydrolase, partial [Acidobacteriota bacterium]|nr:HAD family hydrolase [Acidobacteriota bacterium]